MSLPVQRECHFSPCRRYRYSLKIVWDAALGIQMFIGCNPSTADEERDDPTVRRCIDYCRTWGKGGLLMANACAFRATDPDEMLAADEPIGEENTVQYLEHMAVNVASGLPVACWGRNIANVKVGMLTRHDELRIGMGPMVCLGKNQDGTPVHPLYQPKDAYQRPFNW